MLFNSLEYVLFFCLVFLIFWALARARVLRTAFLLVASFLFYASWNPVYVLLILGSTLIDYLCGRAIASTSCPGRRKLYLVLSLTGNLGLLAVFKYANFGWGSTLAAAGLLGLDTTGLPRAFDIVLPVGISFYTFQTMSYSLDIYRGLLTPRRSLREFALYVAFFPQLVAGPIVRAREFLPQLDRAPRLSASRAGEGLFLVLKGMVKKVALADFLAVNLVDRAFDNPAWYSSPEMLLALYAYSLQIYFDFSAYTDIARGSATLLGFELPENFRRPFQAQTVAEFWQRWHMTLTSWIRDYLYIPLGGSRAGVWRTYRNIGLTWLLMGLWHGACWTYVAWGGYFGLLLMANHLRRQLAARARAQRLPGLLGAARCFSTITIVSLSWILFRSESFAKAGLVLERVLAWEGGLGQISASLWLVLLLGWAIHLGPASWMVRARDLFARAPALLQGVAVAAVGAALLYLSDEMPVPFIYFQF